MGGILRSSSIDLSLKGCEGFLETTGNFDDQACSLFNPSDPQFHMLHLENVVGHFTKLRTYHSGKMDATLVQREFSHHHRFKMTPKLVHRTKVLDYDAPLMLVPPATDESATFLRQLQASQEFEMALMRCAKGLVA